MDDLQASVAQARNAWKFTIDSIRQDAAEGAKAIQAILNPKVEPAGAREKPPKPEGKGKDERLREWQQELQQFRDAEDGFHSISKAEEASYWRDKLAIAKDSAELYAQVYHLARDAERQAQKQSFSDEAKNVEDKLKAESAGSLERVVILQEFLAHAKAIGADQTEEYKRLQGQLVTVTREYQEQQAKLVVASEEQKVAATRKGSEERMSAERDVLLAMQRLGLQNTTEYQGQLKKMIEATREWQTERGKLAQIGAEIEKSVEDHNFAERKKQIEFLAQTGQISKQEELRQLQALENAKFQIEYQGMVRRIQLASLDPMQSPEQVARLTQQLLKLEQVHENAVTDLANKGIQQRQAAYERGFLQLTSGFKSAITGMLNGTLSFTQGVQKMWAGMVTNFVEGLAQQLQKWIAHKVAMLIIHNTTNEAMVVSDAAAAAQSAEISYIAALKKLSQSAAVAAGRVYEALAGIPIIGPVIAPIGAAAAYLGVMALGGSMASAEGGMVSEKEQLAFVHRNEMVLPAALSRGFQNLLGGGERAGALAGGGAMHVHWAPQIQAFDSTGVDRVLRDHGGKVIKYLGQARRKGSI